MKETIKTVAVRVKVMIETNCLSCDRDTKHKPLSVFRRTHLTEYSDFVSDYMTLQCGGCDTISFCRREYIHDAIPEDDDQFFDFNYPGTNDMMDEEVTFLRDVDLDYLPNKIYDLYDEVRKTFITGSVLMAGVGLRMLVEAICLEQKIPGRNLQEKIKKLQLNGMISMNDMPILDKLRLIGNDSAHNIKSIPMDKMAYALDIINHILKSIYVLPKINKKLKI